VIGHSQAQYMVRHQPMKMAAAEALWETADPASLSLFTISDLRNRRDVISIRIPFLLSVLAYDRPTGEVQGINPLQAENEARYEPGDYIPFVPLIYWSFRAMVGAGFLMVGLAAWAFYLVLRRRVTAGRFLRWLPFAILLPYLANSTGWIMTEMGRQPWIVYGVMRTAAGVSVAVSGGMVLLSLVGFTLVYGALMAVDVYLLARYAQADTAESAHKGESALTY